MENPDTLSENNINKLKVLTYNIWFAESNRNERLIALIETINLYDPDIICLQEVIPVIHDHLKMCLNKEYPYIFPGKLITKYDCVILSKYPFISTEEYDFPQSTMGRKLLATIINFKSIKNDDANLSVSNLNIVIATAHFESLFGDYNKRKIDQYIKAKEILDEMTKKYGPVIFCADTNIANPLCEEKYYLTNDSNWIDCWIEDGSKKDEEFTYDSCTNDNLKNRNLNKEYKTRIDRIVYVKNKTFKTVKFELIKGIEYFIEPSDHYGIMTTFDFTSK